MKADDTLTPPRYQSEKLGRREIFRDIARRVPKDKLRLFMTMTQVAAAKVRAGVHIWSMYRRINLFEV